MRFRGSTSSAPLRASGCSWPPSSSDGYAISDFQSRLGSVQWHDGLRQSSELQRFSLRDAQFFEVEGSFPRMPDDYVPPRGIVAIKYSIDLSSRSVLDMHRVGAIVEAM
jgi:hypothetical protein